MVHISYLLLFDLSPPGNKKQIQVGARYHGQDSFLRIGVKLPRSSKPPETSCLILAYLGRLSSKLTFLTENVSFIVHPGTL
jgi:hypothetical protein